MPTRYLSDGELARLAGYSETIADEDLVPADRPLEARSAVSTLPCLATELIAASGSSPA